MLVLVDEIGVGSEAGPLAGIERAESATEAGVGERGPHVVGSFAEVGRALTSSTRRAPVWPAVKRLVNRLAALAAVRILR